MSLGHAIRQSHPPRSPLTPTLDVPAWGCALQGCNVHGAWAKCTSGDRPLPRRELHYPGARVERRRHRALKLYRGIMEGLESRKRMCPPVPQPSSVSTAFRCFQTLLSVRPAHLPEMFCIPNRPPYESILVTQTSSMHLLYISYHSPSFLFWTKSTHATVRIHNPSAVQGTLQAALSTLCRLTCTQVSFPSARRALLTATQGSLKGAVGTWWVWRVISVLRERRAGQ